jgi:enoyl-CoA hydratase/carnithine racemase
VPEAGASYTVPRRFGLAKASEALLLGDAFDAAEAHRLGLVNAVVEPALLREHALKQAARLAAKPRGAIAASRRLIRGDVDVILARIDEEARAFEAALKSDEARAAFMAFMSKGRA